MLNISKWFYDTAYRFSTPPWDNGRIPPQLVALADRRKLECALDLGCGTGTQSIYLTQHGWSVVGVDLAPKAIELAREKARRMGTQVDFKIADVTRLDFLSERGQDAAVFDLIVDLGCFHGLDSGSRKRYAQNLARLSRSGSTFLLYALDHHNPFGIGAAAGEIAQLFAPHFAVTQVEQGTYLGKRTTVCYHLSRV